MRALVYHRTGHAAEVLTVADLPVPDPGPGEVRVRIQASGVNPHDTKSRSGWAGRELPGSGVIPHSDGAGVIDAVGPGVDPARMGERVFVLNAPHGAGTAAEYTCVPSDRAPALPETFSAAEGACIGVPAYTAWLAVLADGRSTGRSSSSRAAAGRSGASRWTLPCARARPSWPRAAVTARAAPQRPGARTTSCPPIRLRLPGWLPI